MLMATTAMCSPLELPLKRQKGTEYSLLNIDGVLIAAPAAIGSLRQLPSVTSASSDLDEGKDESYEFDAVVIKDDKDDSSKSQLEQENQLTGIEQWNFKRWFGRWGQVKWSQVESSGATDKKHSK